MNPVPVPCVWVVASHRELGNPDGNPQCYTVMDEAGSRTLVNMGMQPVCYPRVPDERLEAVLAHVDGVLLGGSDTNVHPRLFAEAPAAPDLQYDAERDRLAPALIRLAIRHRVPVIAFCRGSHDFNVCMGGSLHQSLRQRAGGVQHWEEEGESLDEQYAERHDVSCAPGGELERLTGLSRFPASSLHSQGVKVLGHGLVAEAHADDGLVEAFRWHDPSLFAWGFQFHPEWGWRWHPAYGRIMDTFAQACWARLAQRGGAQRAERIAAATSAKPAPRSPSLM
ncbi:gamma-glutamyl-gamma-aminobutyrate hydrolase family protein [Caenimonas sedimenti]|nr:gamma-glutamyl-gamma-aminobutyrate hydrolase family protein [Caenimonas sedimenti]